LDVVVLIVAGDIIVGGTVFVVVRFDVATVDDIVVDELIFTGDAVAITFIVVDVTFGAFVVRTVVTLIAVIKNRMLHLSMRLNF
jgi:hypothetical protein